MRMEDYFRKFERKMMGMEDYFRKFERKMMRMARGAR